MAIATHAIVKPYGWLTCLDRGTLLQEQIRGLVVWTVVCGQRLGVIALHGVDRIKDILHTNVHHGNVQWLYG